MVFRRWKIAGKDIEGARQLAAETGIPLLVARVLRARGTRDADAANSFLSSFGPLEQPCVFKDIEPAVTRICGAISSGERIAVFGDYDVDGITSTTLMYQFLQSSGADVVCSLPTREADGYGLSSNAIDNLSKYGVKLVVTVDNGISAVSEIEYAKSLGIDVVVCDHHLPTDKLPQAVAVVDPLRSDDESTYKELAGVGVAAKLVAAVEGCSVEEILDTYAYLVALGTVSDIMPLTGENRRTVITGIEQIREGVSPGLNALCETAGQDIESADAKTLAFTIAPRLNAAGRMGDSTLALRLLLTEDDQEAKDLAHELENLNIQRQAAEQESSDRVFAALLSDKRAFKMPIIVVAAEDLHQGVIGIVCSRLVDRFGKPTVIITADGDIAKGSGRSVDGFSLHDAIASCADVLEKFGGHDMAAGFTLKTSDIETFKEKLFCYCKENTPPCCPPLRIDEKMGLGEIDEASVSGLMCLEPYGCMNEEPVFCVGGAFVASITPLGEKHSRVTIKEGGKSLSGALFGVVPGDLPFGVGDKVDAAFCLSLYTAEGRKPSVSVRFRDFRPENLSGDAYDSVESYSLVNVGFTLSDDAKKSINICREDVACVYKKLLKHELICEPMHLAFALPELMPGRALAVLDVLCELGLAERYCEGVFQKARANATKEKRELTSSATYTLLCEDVPQK